MEEGERDERVYFPESQKPYGGIDVLINNPIDFGEMKSASDVIDARTVRIPIASIDHSIALKKISNRKQDKSDIVALQKIRRLREKR